MKYDPDIHHRQSIRLRGFDYASAGAYFITICSQEREFLFGEIADGEVVLNAAGEIIKKWWQNVPVHFPHVQLDEYVIMPNHFHGMLWIVGAGSPRPGPTPTHCGVGAGSPRPISPECQNQGGVPPPLRRPTLGQIVGYFKYQSTKGVNEIRDNPGVPVWQRNYYERVIRDEDELHRARRYIRGNPSQWETDAENPANAAH